MEAIRLSSPVVRLAGGVRHEASLPALDAGTVSNGRTAAGVRKTKDSRSGSGSPGASNDCIASELSKLAQWADRATSHELESVRTPAAKSALSCVAPNLPLLPAQRAYWGDRLLIPIGHRPEPALNERTLLEAFGVAEAEIAILQERGVR